MPKSDYRQLAWTDETVTRFWGWQSQFPETYFTNLFGGRIVRRLRSSLSGVGSVLDYGCGVGFLVPHLAALSGKVWAADFSPDSVAAANERNRGVTNFQGARMVADLVQAGQSFDRVLAVEVIEHLSDEHLASFFDNLRLLLGPGGRAVITTPNDEDLRGWETYCPCCDHVFHRFQHVRSFSAQTLAETVRGNGLEPVEVFVTDFSRRPWWHLKQLGRDLMRLLLGQPKRFPHLVCVARIPK